MSNCKIAIFYIDHFDAIAIKAITSTLFKIKNKGFDKICFATFKPQTLSEHLDLLTYNIDKINYRLSQELKEETENELKETLFSLISIRNLFTRVQEQGIEFFPIDMEKDKKLQAYGECKKDKECLKVKVSSLEVARQEIMAEEIDKVCNNSGDNILVLLGLGNKKLPSLLQAKGYTDITGFWISGMPQLKLEEKLYECEANSRDNYMNTNYNLDMYVIIPEIEKPVDLSAVIIELFENLF